MKPRLAMTVVVLAAFAIGAWNNSEAEQGSIKIVKQRGAAGETVQLDPACRKCIPEGCRIDCSHPPTVGKAKTVVELRDDLPDLSSGENVKIRGYIKDADGLPINGRIFVFQNGAMLGLSYSAAGAYRVYDIPAGNTELFFSSMGGCTASKTVDVKETDAITGNFVCHY